MYTIAIDCGASFVKGALIDEEKILFSIEENAPKVPENEKIMDSSQIRELVLLVKGMIQKLAEVGEISEVKLCISNEMHGFLLAFEDGAPFTDYISWQKEFGKFKKIDGISSLEVLADLKYEKEIIRTGMPLRTGLPSCNLLYLSMQGILHRTDRKLYFYTLGDYILKALLHKEPFCHPTNAAATGLYDIEKGTWNRNLTSLVCGTNDVCFPKIGQQVILGNIGNLCVYAFPALGDQQAALLGCGLQKENALSFNLGTGAQVSRLTRKIEYSKDWQVRPYFNGYFLKTIPHLPCGRALNVYVNFFVEFLKEFLPEITTDQVWKVLLSMEENASENTLQCDLSFFENAVTSATKGSISNIEETTFSVGNLMTAIFSQMSQNFIWAADRISTDTIREILFSGGVSRKISTIREQILLHYWRPVATSVT